LTGASQHAPGVPAWRQYGVLMGESWKLAQEPGVPAW